MPVNLTICVFMVFCTQIGALLRRHNQEANIMFILDISYYGHTLTNTYKIEEAGEAVADFMAYSTSGYKVTLRRVKAGVSNLINSNK